MGMTQDLELALAEGSTMLRIGTAIFGERPHSEDKVPTRHLASSGLAANRRRMS
jgi:hypothetical protein